MKDYPGDTIQMVGYQLSYAAFPPYAGTPYPTRYRVVKIAHGNNSTIRCNFNQHKTPG